MLPLIYLDTYYFQNLPEKANPYQHYTIVNSDVASAIIPLLRGQVAIVAIWHNTMPTPFFCGGGAFFAPGTEVFKLTAPQAADVWPDLADVKGSALEDRARRIFGIPPVRMTDFEGVVAGIHLALTYRSINKKSYWLCVDNPSGSISQLYDLWQPPHLTQIDAFKNRSGSHKMRTFSFRYDPTLARNSSRQIANAGATPWPTQLLGKYNAAALVKRKLLPNEEGFGFLPKRITIDKTDWSYCTRLKWDSKQEKLEWS